MLKKRICILFLVLSVFIFVGIKDVNASEAFTCKYYVKNAVSHPYVVLTKEVSGEIKVYYLGDGNDKDGDYTDPDWITFSKFKINSNAKNDGGELVGCPEHVRFNDEGELVFNNGLNPSNVDLIDEQDKTFSELNGGASSSIIPGTNLTGEYGKGSFCGSLDLDKNWLRTPSAERSCLYARNISLNMEEEKNNCLIVQVDISSGRADAVTNYVLWKDSISGFESFNNNEFFDVYPNSCPSYIYASDVSGTYKQLKISVFEKTFEPEVALFLINSTEEEDLENVKIDDCEDLISGDLRDTLNWYMNLFRMVVPIIVLVLGIVDFAAAMFSSREDNMKKNVEKFVKRLIIAVVIFLIPTLVNVLLDIANTVWGWNAGNCGIK